jgi:heme O synthase-like polyprenyltransferase
MNPSAPPKPNRISKILLGIIVIMAGVPSLLCWMFFYGKVYGILGYVINFAFVAIVWRFHRKRRIKAERMHQIDKAMGKPSDDPRQMARWIP